MAQGHRSTPLIRLSCCALVLATLAAHPDVASAATLIIGASDSNNGIPFDFFSDIPDYQQVYASTAFSGSVDIGSVTFYDNTQYSGPGDNLGTGNIELFLSTTSSAVNGLGTPLSANNGADRELVYSGPASGVTQSAITGGLAFTFGLSSAFDYDPSAGNLLLEIVAPANGQVVLAAGNSPDTSRGYITGGLTYTDSAGLLTGFEVTPVPLPSAVWLMLSGLLGLMGVRRTLRPGRP